MQIITSKENEMIKIIRKLKEKKYRDENHAYVVEGIKMIGEAINEKAMIKRIVMCEENMHEGEIDKKLLYEIAKYECIYVNKTIFEWISNVQNPQ